MAQHATPSYHKIMIIHPATQSAEDSLRRLGIGACTPHVMWSRIRFLFTAMSLAAQSRLSNTIRTQTHKTTTHTRKLTKPLHTHANSQNHYTHTHTHNHHHTHTTTTSFTPFSAFLPDGVDTTALERALLNCVDRHAALRSSYTSFGEVAREEPPGSVSLDMRVENGSREDVHKTLECMMDVARDLSSPSSVRIAHLHAVVLRPDGASSAILCMLTPKFAMDSSSIRVLLNDVNALYGGLTDVASMPPVEMQFPQFLEWRKETLSGPTGASLLDFWRETLAAPLPVLEFPLDHPRPPKLTTHTGMVEFSITKFVMSQLRVLARKFGATMQAVMLCAWRVFLHRYTGATDVIIASCVSCRGEPEIAKSIGDFSNIIYARVSLAGNPSFTRMLDREWTSLQVSSHLLSWCASVDHVRLTECILAHAFAA